MNDPSDGVQLRRFSNGNWFAFNREIAQDKALSDKAVACLAYLLSKPDDWKPQVFDIRNRFGWGRDKWRDTARELAAAGYFRRSTVNGEGGKLVNVIEYADHKAFAPCPENPSPADSHRALKNRTPVDRTPVDRTPVNQAAYMIEKVPNRDLTENRTTPPLPDDSPFEDFSNPSEPSPTIQLWQEKIRQTCAPVGTGTQAETILFQQALAFQQAGITFEQFEQFTAAAPQKVKFRFLFENFGEYTTAKRITAQGLTNGNLSIDSGTAPGSNIPRNGYVSQKNAGADAFMHALRSAAQ